MKSSLEKLYKANIDAQREEIATKSGAYEKDLEAARKVRETATKDVDVKILKYYDRILSGRAPSVLYPLDAGACGHCHTSVPMHRRQQARPEGRDRWRYLKRIRWIVGRRLMTNRSRRIGKGIRRIRRIGRIGR